MDANRFRCAARFAPPIILLAGLLVGACAPEIPAVANPEVDAGGCPHAGPCDLPGDDPCQDGEAGCAEDGTLVCQPRNAPDGQVCGAGRVCHEGACTECAAGAGCSEPGNACRVGVLECTAGASCVALVDAPDGTGCGEGQVCRAGSCLPCASGAKCSDPADPCREGTLDCSVGPVCKGLSSLPDGTTCGANLACLDGVCLCQPGGSCSGGNPCRVGRAACVGGAPVCEGLVDAADGTACGASLACLDGVCVCQPGGSCTLAGAPCQVGRVVCGSGTPVCSATGNAPNGTVCGTDLVCKDGACAACKAGDKCLYGICKLGSWACDTGVQQCVNPTNAANGTVCDTNATPADEVCRAGVCVACQAGKPCSPQVCRVGVTECSTGTEQCAGVKDAPDGDDCGLGRICIGGSCISCTQGAACRPGGNPCQKGIQECAVNPGCVFTGNEPDATVCGASQVCKSGVCVCDDKCAAVGSACGTQPNQVVLCEKEPATGCLAPRTVTCPANQTCLGGACACVNGCAEGATRCVGVFGVQACSKDANGCLSWAPSPAALCPGARPCVNGACDCPAPPADRLYVAEQGGSDRFGNGSLTCPFSSITKGLAVASIRAIQQTVQVAAGEYAAGEVFPLVVPAHVTLRGADGLLVAGWYRIRGDGPIAGNRRATLVANGGSVTGFRIRPAANDRADTVAVVCSAGSPALSDLDVQSYADGIWLDGACTAVLARLDVQECSRGGGRAGLVVTGAASVQLSESSVHNNRRDGVWLDSTSAVPSVLRDNGNRSLQREDGLSANAENGVRCAKSALVRLRANKLWGNGFAGALAEGACGMDASGAGAGGPGGACGRYNDFGCNHQRSGAYANVQTSSGLELKADHNVWQENPPRSGAGRDYLSTGVGGIDVTEPCPRDSDC